MPAEAEHPRSCDNWIGTSTQSKMATTYILKCIDNRYYIGSCVDFAKRFFDHHAGKCKFTRSRLPVELIYSEDYLTVSQARQREYQIKSYKSRMAIEKLIKLGFAARSANG